MIDTNALTERLRPHVATLTAEAMLGDQQAQQVIDLYQLHVAAPQDPGAPALCHAAMDEWLKRRGEL